VITDNVSAIVSPDGAAALVGALGVYNFTNDPKLLTVRNGIISGNTLSASTTAGRRRFRVRETSTTAC